jgi:hypothetical protein
MGRVNRLSKVIGFLCLSLFLGNRAALPVVSDVATTFHVEPDDHPKATVPAKAWFVLTRQGGKVIPLSQCNCKLAVYPLPRQEGKKQPLSKPALNTLNVEQYKGIPSAIITFPKPGIYELEFTAVPKPGVKFKPFTASYEVTVTH